MPNRFTAVPSGPAPAPGAVARRLLPLADAFMVAMISRPPGGTLGTTWVTPATLWLAVASVVAAALLAGLLIAAMLAGGSPLLALGLLACLALAAGAGSVVAVGLDQRRRA